MVCACLEMETVTITLVVQVLKRFQTLRKMSSVDEKEQQPETRLTAGILKKKKIQNTQEVKENVF